MSAVAIDGVWKFYGDYPALRDVRLSAEPGACLALIGRNGAGKTTLLRIVAGFSRPGRGQIRIFGKEPRETATRGKMGFIGHGIAVYDELSRARKPDPVRPALRSGRPAPLRHGMAGAHRPGARPQRPGARVLARHAAAPGGGPRLSPSIPRVLLLDEPFTALDDRAIAVLQRLLREALAEGKHRRHVHPPVARSAGAGHRTSRC